VIRCSSGTYIRALARDLGAALGTGGHLTAIRRTAVGPYDLTQAHTLETLESQTRQNPDLAWITPLAEAAAAAFPRLDLTADEARRLAQGARLPLPPQQSAEPSPPPGTPMAAFAPDDTLVALVTADSHSVRSLAVFVDAPPAVRQDGR
jgi:tRNA pseudouridine55 synthase